MPVPTTVPFRQASVGDLVGTVAADMLGEDDSAIRSVQNLPAEQVAEMDSAIRARLETSRVDHYPKVEKLHIVPGTEPNTAVFLAKVRISGFTPSTYGMIGHYDLRTGVITSLETKRTWRFGAELQDWPLPED